MRYSALAGALLAATMAAGASAQSLRDRDYYDYYGRGYDAPPSGGYGYREQAPRGNAYDEREAYERGRADELYRQRQREQQRRDPSLGEQLGEFLDRQMQPRQPPR